METPMDDERWFCVEQTVNGTKSFIGRIKTTGNLLRAEVGPYAEINPINGECHVWGPKPKADRKRR